MFGQSPLDMLLRHRRGPFSVAGTDAFDEFPMLRQNDVGPFEAGEEPPSALTDVALHRLREPFVDALEHVVVGGLDDGAMEEGIPVSALAAPGLAPAMESFETLQADPQAVGLVVVVPPGRQSCGGHFNDGTGLHELIHGSGGPEGGGPKAGGHVGNIAAADEDALSPPKLQVAQALQGDQRLTEKVAAHPQLDGQLPLRRKTASGAVPAFVDPGRHLFNKSLAFGLHGALSFGRLFPVLAALPEEYYNTFHYW